MNNDLWKLTAVEAVTLLKKREISPLDLVEASARRIAEVESGEAQLIPGDEVLARVRHLLAEQSTSS